MREREYVGEKLNCFICNENEIACFWKKKKANIPTALKENYNWINSSEYKESTCCHLQQENVGIKRMGIATEIEEKVQEKKLALLVISCY